MSARRLVLVDDGNRRSLADLGAVWYVAHPFTAGPGETTAGNVARAKRWLAWLMAVEPDAAFCLGWAPMADIEIERGFGAAFGERCLRDDLAMVAALRNVLLVGGRVSPGMRAEREAAIGAAGRVVDLTGLGNEPPRLITAGEHLLFGAVIA